MAVVRVVPVVGTAGTGLDVVVERADRADPRRPTGTAPAPGAGEMTRRGRAPRGIGAPDPGRGVASAIVGATRGGRHVAHGEVEASAGPLGRSDTRHTTSAYPGADPDR